jgi:hypothetical protein
VTPVLTDLGPDWTLAGAPYPTFPWITASGSGYFPGMQLAWNARSRAFQTMAWDGTSASLRMADLGFAAAGVVELFVLNPTGPRQSNSRPFFVINQASTIVQSVSPLPWPAGQAGVLEVRGDNFIPSTTVLWNGRPVPVDVVSPTLLRVTLSALHAPVTGPASAQLTVRTPYTYADISTVTKAIAIEGTATPRLPRLGERAGETQVIATNPMPRVTALNPPYARAGAASPVTLSVRGSGFVQGSVVRMAGADLATAFISSTELRTAIPASMLVTRNQNVAVAVFNPPPGGGLSNAVRFTVR